MKCPKCNTEMQVIFMGIIPFVWRCPYCSQVEEIKQNGERLSRGNGVRSLKCAVFVAYTAIVTNLMSLR